MEAARVINAETWQATSNGNGSQGSLPKSYQPESAWRWFAAKVRGLVKQVEERRYSISQPMALVLVGIMGTVVVGAWFGYQAEHDARIRMETRLELMEKAKADQDSKIDQARNFASVADKNNARLEGKFDEFSTIYAIKKETGKDSQ